MAIILARVQRERSVEVSDCVLITFLPLEGDNRPIKKRHMVSGIIDNSPDSRARG